MKRNYERIIDVVLGILFVMLLYGFSQSIVLLDARLADYGSYQEFADKILFNDSLLIGFTSASILLCLVYALFDFKTFKKGRLFQFIIGLCLLAMSVYIFIILVSLRQDAYSVAGYSTQVTLTLYQQYRNISLLIIFSQFIISIHALARSVYQYLHHEEKKVEDESSL